MTNFEIAKLLRNVAASYTIKDENKFRFQIIAYQKAADAIQNSSSEVMDLFKEKKLSLLPGVGPSISSHLEELLKTGKVKHFNWVTQGIPKAVFPLLGVPTIGPKKAFRLTTELSLKNPETAVNDLKKKGIQGKIAKIEGFGEKSQDDILEAIADFEQGKGKTTRMALPYAFEIAEKLVSYLKTSKSVIQAVPLGSLRRMMPTVGDIDIAVATNYPKSVITHFVSYPYKERIIEEGKETASILLSNGKQIDLMTQPPEAFGALLQHFTGSKNHNIKLREHALSMGLSVSEHGIKKQVASASPPASSPRLPEPGTGGQVAGEVGRGKWQMAKYSREEEFYKALGMDWIPPELREDTGEVELAIKHKLPKLVSLQEIRGDLHIHSNFPIDPSHDLGKNSIEEMVKFAKELKYEYIGFSEHNPSISKHTKKQIYDLIARRNYHIEQIKSQIKSVRIIKLLEIDILVNGDLAINNSALELLDAAIVSIHSSFGMSKEQMTKRVLQGLSHPKAKILAHPTGRMLNQRPGYELDFEKIFDFCKKYRKALEINSWPERLDLPDPIIKQAVESGVKLVINTDSHAVSEMNLMKHGIAMARRGWAKKSDILNTMGYNYFAEWLKGGEM